MCLIWHRSHYALNYSTGDDTFIAILPFFHIYGQVVVMLAGLASGAKIVILPKFEPKIFLDTLQNYAVRRPTVQFTKSVKTETQSSYKRYYLKQTWPKTSESELSKF